MKSKVLRDMDEVAKRTTVRANKMLQAKHPDLTLHEWETKLILLAFLEEVKEHVNA